MKKELTTVFCIALSMTVSAQSEIYPQHFDLEEVTLLDSPQKRAMELNDSILFEYDVDRLLTCAIMDAGLNDDSSSKYYKWSDTHPVYSIWYYESTIPHYVSSLAIAYAASHDKEMKARLLERLNYCLEVLKDCQNANDDSTDGLKGYLGTERISVMWKSLYAGNENTFYQYTGWCPYYYIHKMLAGLRDAWIYADNKMAMEMYRKLADWSGLVISNLTDSQVQKVLGASEHGGMVEVLADAYRLFGDSKYLDYAKRYEHKEMLDGMQTLNLTLLDGKHANTQVPKYMGLERVYQEELRSGRETSGQRERTAAHNFWTDVVNNRTVCIGGNSVSEHFLAAGNSKQYIENLEGPETCNSYNMLKLSEILFDETHDARYADFYESTMWNHIMSSQNPRTGGFVYFTPLRPQSYRIYSTTNLSLWCCVGTGMENHSRYGHFIYTHSEDNSTLYVNLFIPSQLESETFAVTQRNNYPSVPSTTITVDRGGRFTLAVRHPWWTTESFSVTVNGEAVACDVELGKAGYVNIEREWKAGDVVEVSLPMQLRYETCPNYGDYVAFKYGPLLLAAKTTSSSEGEAERTGLPYENLPRQFADGSRWGHSPSSMTTPLTLMSSPLLIGDRDSVIGMVKPTDTPLDFTVEASDEYGKTEWPTLHLVPFYTVHESRYVLYFYQQTEEGFKNGEMGRADSLETVLNLRTVDFVGTGEQQSELAHDASYSSGSNTGIAAMERYRDVTADGYIQYTLFNPDGLTDGLSLLCRFNTYDKARKSTILIDGAKLVDVTIPAQTGKANSQGLFDWEYPIPSEMMLNDDGSVKKQITFRLQASSSTMAPGLYYLRLLKDFDTKLYKFTATDWVSIDANRLTQDKIGYDLSANTITVSPGTGNNNVCLQLDQSMTDYYVRASDKYLIVKGTGLSLLNGKSYLWWLNGVNKGSSVSPTYTATASDGEKVIAWDITKSGLDGNSQTDPWNSTLGLTCFGLTSLTGTSTISYIGFQPSFDDFVNAVGIDGVLDDGMADADSHIYNLQGQRQLRPTGTKGIYITDGEKYLRR